MPAPRVAAFIPAFHGNSYAKYRDVVIEVEQLGADVVLTTDHFFPQRGNPDGPNFECWSLLAAWSEATSNIEIGALVSSIGYRNPDLVADMARTIDHISDGRLILGLGSGWMERDYIEYGYDFGTAGKRLDYLAEAIPRIKRRLTKLNPPPTRRLPILIGGGGVKKTLRITAEHADIWHFFVDVDSYREKAAILADHCAAVGRNPAEIEHCAEVSEAPDPMDFTHRIHDAGVNLISVAVQAPDFDTTLLKQVLKWRDRLSTQA